MENNKIKSIIEAILFSAGKPVTKKELMLSVEVAEEDIENIISNMQEEYKKEERGIQIVKIEDAYQLCTKSELYEYIYPIIDKRSQPTLSNAAIETLAIIAYNPRITRAEIESIRGVGADACVYKLLEYGLVEEAGKADLPGKPMSYRTTKEFLRKFGYSSLDELPELPRYKLDANRQIVIDELVEQVKTEQVQQLKNENVEQVQQLNNENVEQIQQLKNENVEQIQQLNNENVEQVQQLNNENVEQIKERID